ncbi:MAG: PDZ domain-containing protein, partial [Calothrix sp. SM1_5_4]|nr:PDZ domain-containing protein [Calothrix sp. SM1_5_4]
MEKRHLNWDIEAEYRRALADIDSLGEVSAKDYRRVISTFLKSARDYHVGFSFHATEKARLPFQVSGADGKYFVVWIDENKLSGESFPVQVGDELVTWNDRPVGEVVAELREQGNWGRALHRSAPRGAHAHAAIGEP